MRNIGLPVPSSPYGIREPNGEPGCFFEFVESVPIVFL
jgi:hypothetical protein